MYLKLFFTMLLCSGLLFNNSCSRPINLYRTFNLYGDIKVVDYKDTTQAGEQAVKLSWTLNPEARYLLLYSNNNIDTRIISFYNSDVIIIDYQTNIAYYTMNILYGKRFTFLDASMRLPNINPNTTPPGITLTNIKIVKNHTGDNYSFEVVFPAKPLIGTTATKAETEEDNEDYIKLKVKSIDKEVTSTKSDIKKLVTKIDAVKDSLTTVKGSMDEFKDNINKVSEDVEDIKSGRFPRLRNYDIFPPNPIPRRAEDDYYRLYIENDIRLVNYNKYKNGFIRLRCAEVFVREPGLFDELIKMKAIGRDKITGRNQEYVILSPEYLESRSDYLFEKYKFNIQFPSKNYSYTE